MKNDRYAVINSHMRGASHIAKGMECEDFSEVYLDENIAIAVISDGHGDKNCFRSALGAKFACKSAISTVLKLANYDELKKSPDRVITEIEKNIILSWNDLVMEDVNNNPIKESELSSLDSDVVEMLRSGRRIQKVYGCTLIMTCILDNFWFGIHVGDGKCVCVFENGLYSQPIPWDNVGCVGNRSTSICDSKAFDNFRYVYGTDIPTASFVASDGVDESFDENGLNKCYYSLAVWAKTLNDDELKTSFDQLLDRISQGGSGDDVSIAGIVSVQREVKKPVATSRQVAEKMGEMFGTLKEIEARYIELRDRDSELDETISRVENEIERLEKEIEEKKKSIEDKKIEIDSVKRNLQNVTEQYREISDQFKVAKERKKQVDDYWKSLGVKPTDTSDIDNYEPIEIIEAKEVNKGIHPETEYNGQQETTPTVIDPKDDVSKEDDMQRVDPHQEVDSGILSDHESTHPIQPSIKKAVSVEEPSVQKEYKKTGLFGNLFRKG